MFSDRVVSLDEIAGRLRELYAWLTFGASRDGELEHLCWAMPPADEGDWLAHIDVLKRKSGGESSHPTPRPVEPPSSTITLRFREHIEERLSGEKDKEEDKE